MGLQKFPFSPGPVSPISDFHQQGHKPTQCHEISNGTAHFLPLSSTQPSPP